MASPRIETSAAGAARSPSPSGSAPLPAVGMTIAATAGEEHPGLVTRRSTRIRLLQAQQAGEAGGGSTPRPRRATLPSNGRNAHQTQRSLGKRRLETSPEQEEVALKSPRVDMPEVATMAMDIAPSLVDDAAAAAGTPGPEPVAWPTNEFFNSLAGLPQEVFDMIARYWLAGLGVAAPDGRQVLLANRRMTYNASEFGRAAFDARTYLWYVDRLQAHKASDDLRAFAEVLAKADKVWLGPPEASLTGETFWTLMDAIDRLDPKRDLTQAGDVVEYALPRHRPTAQVHGIAANVARRHTGFALAEDPVIDPATAARDVARQWGRQSLRGAGLHIPLHIVRTYWEAAVDAPVLLRRVMDSAFRADVRTEEKYGLLEHAYAAARAMKDAFMDVAGPPSGRRPVPFVVVRAVVMFAKSEEGKRHPERCAAMVKSVLGQGLLGNGQSVQMQLRGLAEVMNDLRKLPVEAKTTLAERHLAPGSLLGGST